MIDSDYEGSRGEFLKLLAEQGEEPAFVLRRRRVDAALEQVRWNCRGQQRVHLHGPRLHLRTIASIVQGDWSRLSCHLAAPSQWRVFESLHDDWNRQSPPRSWSDQGRWTRRLDGSLGEFRQSVDRFNRSWDGFLAAFDLSSINTAIAGYNDYYVLEKSCALGREDLAERGFEPIALMTVQTLLDEFPPVDLPAPRTS